MSAIAELKAASDNTVWAIVPTSGTNEDEQTKKFSTMLERMKSGGSAGTGEDDASQKTTTETQIMADGSVLITVWQDGRIISETRTGKSYDEQLSVIQQSSQQSGTTPVRDAQQSVGGLGAASLLNFLARP